MNSHIGQSTRVGAWIFILLTICMSFASIWIFTRMAPATAVILEENERSLAACEEMLVALLVDNPQQFQDALTLAEKNTTEAAEPQMIKEIRQAIPHNPPAAIAAIRRLAEINRNAMEHADKKAQQLGKAGAWGVVFMASAIFLTGMIFLRTMQRNLIEPLIEIDAVANANIHGDTIRRCSLKAPAREIQQIFEQINTILDLQLR